MFGFAAEQVDFGGRTLGSKIPWLFFSMNLTFYQMQIELWILDCTHLSHLKLFEMVSLVLAGHYVFEE